MQFECLIRELGETAPYILQKESEENLCATSLELPQRWAAKSDKKERTDQVDGKAPEDIDWGSAPVQRQPPSAPGTASAIQLLHHPEEAKTIKLEEIPL